VYTRPMIHTSRVRQALQFAARRHHGQMRMETEPLPYITHPVSVAILLADADADEDTIIAGLLHDVIEDTKTSAEEITEAFGEKVTVYVLSVSEPKIGESGERLTWRGRKETYLAQLAVADTNAVLVSMADKVDNIETKLESAEREGPEFHTRWSQKPEEYIWFHGSVLEEARKRNITGVLRDRLETVCSREKENLS
jgi:(p)ppGpp synthase/HD superfamily hydrolase